MGPKNCFYVKKFFSVIFSQKIQNLGKGFAQKTSQIRGEGGHQKVKKNFFAFFFEPFPKHNGNHEFRVV